MKCIDSKRKVSQVFNNNPQGSRLRGRPKNRRWSCVQTHIDKCRIKNWKEKARNIADWDKSNRETKVRFGLLSWNEKKRKKRKKKKEEAWNLWISKKSVGRAWTEFIRIRKSGGLL